jgi:hypothetical protein
VQYEVFDVFFLRKLDVVFFVDRWTRVLAGGECDLASLTFILQILRHFWIASMSVCSLRDAMVGSLSVATTAASQAKVAW